RSSRASRTRRARFGALRVGWEAVRENRLRIQERSDMETSGNRMEPGRQPPAPLAGSVKGQGRQAGPDARTVGATSPRHSAGTTKEFSATGAHAERQPVKRVSERCSVRWNVGAGRSLRRRWTLTRQGGKFTPCGVIAQSLVLA